MTRILLLLLPALGLAVAAHAAPNDADTLDRTGNPERYRISVSATKLPVRTENVANAMTIVSGDELRRRGTHTLAEALQDVAGFDTGEGSDNGTSVPNLGLWGLKEFDALLVTLDGVPVGGPFNPSLTLIPIEDIDRIEVVKGPQGTLYGISAFAGMVQVFTRHSLPGEIEAQVGGGSFSSWHGQVSASRALVENTQLLGSGIARNSDGWQDRTALAHQRGRIALSRPFGKVQTTLEGGAFYDHQEWGSPLPVDGGKPIGGFEIDHNYGVRGARLDHHVVSGNLRMAMPVGDHVRLENTIGGYNDRQLSVRSFVEPDSTTSAPGVVTPSEGVAIRPIETSVFEDLRVVVNFNAQGDHQLVAGAAVTYGKMTADGKGFDFDQTLGDFSTIPDEGSVPPGDLRSFSDRRTFVGAYARDEWTPYHWVTIGGGGRYDNASETLHAEAQEQGPPLGPLEVADDERTDHAWSGDLSSVVRLFPHRIGMFDVLNLYGNWKSSFKPAAPNLQEPEGAEILDHERTHSVEGGIKARAYERQVDLDLSAFDMTFENMVVSTIVGGTPTLVNAGKERFKGYEAELSVRPNVVPGTTISLGYAFHDARFVNFTFVAGDGVTLRDVSGKQIELVPHELFNARVDLTAPMGFGVFGAVRYQGKRPLTRRNTFWDEPFTEYDAGASYTHQRFHVSIVGRNLGDDRHYTTESEIGDSMFYVSPPRRVNAEVSFAY